MVSPEARVVTSEGVNTVYRHFRDSAQTLTIVTSLKKADPLRIGYRFSGSDAMITHRLGLPPRSRDDWTRVSASVNPIGTILARPGEADAGISQGSASMIYEIQGSPE